MTTDHSEAMSQLPHKLATLIKYLPQAPFRDHLAAECIKQAERIAELEREIANLHTTMMAAAVEIHEHWGAHCDAEGYGPANLMHRLERGIASQYGYDAKTLQRVEAELDTLRAEVERLREFFDADMAVSKVFDEVSPGLTSPKGAEWADRADAAVARRCAAVSAIESAKEQQ